MASDLDIANMALRHLAVTTGPIAALTERSKEAKSVNLFLPQVREEVLRDHPWSFATHVDLLALVEEEPTNDWLFAYRYPDNCVTFRRILSESQLRVSMFNAGEIRYPVNMPKLKFRVARDSVGKLIYTNEEAPYGEWTELLTDPTDYPPDVVQVMALLLATYIAPSVHGADPKLGDRAFALYQQKLARAKQNDGNESNLDLNDDSSELERART